MFITPDDVRLYLTLNAAQDETLLTALCAGVEAFVLSYLSLDTIDAIERTQVYNGNGSCRFLPDNRPITAVASVTIDGISIPAASDVHASGFIFGERTIYQRGYHFNVGVQNVVIKYTAGWDPVPDDLKRAACDIVAEKYQRRLRQGIVSKSLGTESITYSTNDVTPFARQVLGTYRRPMLSRA